MRTTVFVASWDPSLLRNSRARAHDKKRVSFLAPCFVPCPYCYAEQETFEITALGVSIPSGISSHSILSHSGVSKTLPDSGTRHWHALFGTVSSMRYETLTPRATPCALTVTARSPGTPGSRAWYSPARGYTSATTGGVAWHRTPARVPMAGGVTTATRLYAGTCSRRGSCPGAKTGASARARMTAPAS